MKNVWKKTLAGLTALILVAGAMPANVGGLGLFSSTAIVACAESSEWTLTSPADLETDDIIMIVDQNSSRAIANNEVSYNPAAVSVDLNNLTGIADNLQWRVIKNGDVYQFAVPGTENFLYNQNKTNLGVGNYNNLQNVNLEHTQFKIVNGENGIYYLMNSATSRYIAVLNNNSNFAVKYCECILKIQ